MGRKWNTNSKFRRKNKKIRKINNLAHYLDGNDKIGCGLSQNISKKLKEKQKEKFYIRFHKKCLMLIKIFHVKKAYDDKTNNESNTKYNQQIP